MIEDIAGGVKLAEEVSSTVACDRVPRAANLGRALPDGLREVTSLFGEARLAVVVVLDFVDPGLDGIDGARIPVVIARVDGEKVLTIWATLKLQCQTSRQCKWIQV